MLNEKNTNFLNAGKYLNGIKYKKLIVVIFVSCVSNIIFSQENKILLSTENTEKIILKNSDIINGIIYVKNISVSSVSKGNIQATKKKLAEFKPYKKRTVKTKKNETIFPEQKLLPKALDPNKEIVVFPANNGSNSYSSFDGDNNLSASITHNRISKSKIVYKEFVYSNFNFYYSNVLQAENKYSKKWHCTECFVIDNTIGRAPPIYGTEYNAENN